MVQLIVTVKTHPGRVADYAAAFRALAPGAFGSRVYEYDIYHDSNDSRFDNEVRPDTVVLCEKWASIEALQRHTAAARHWTSSESRSKTSSWRQAMCS